MIVVIFEYYLNKESGLEYKSVANELYSQLDGIDGFVSIESFNCSNDTVKGCSCHIGVMKNHSKYGAI